MALDFSKQAKPYTPQQALRDSATRLSLAPDDLATAIAYETGGTFDPWQKGPVTKWGEHRGLIQWGEPQRQQYGVTQDTSFQEQVMQAEKYFLDRGFKPGEHGLRDLYSTINAGSPGKYAASDRPGYDVDRHVNEMEGYRERARAFLSSDQQIIEPATQLAQYEPIPGGLDFSSQAKRVDSAPQAYEPIPGGLDFSSQAKRVAPAQPPSGQQERLPVGEAGSAAPVGEGVVLPSPAVQASPESDTEGGMFDWFWRSKYQYETRNVMVDVLNGKKDVPTAAAEFAELVKKQEAIPERQAYVEGAKAHARYVAGKAPEYEGVKGKLKFIYDHPTYNLESLGESGFQMGEALVVGSGGAIVGSLAGPVGTAAGMASGVAASSALTEGIGKYMETLQEAGVDVSSEESLQGAMENPELLAEAKRKGLLKGLTVGAFDGITSLLGARGAGKPLAEGVAKILGQSGVKKTAARQSVEESAAGLLFLEAPGGMAGEAFGELASEGEVVDWIGVMQEGFGEIALGGPQVAVQTAIAAQGRETAVADSQRIKDVVTAITQVPSYEEAVTEGRNWFGFVEGSLADTPNTDPTAITPNTRVHSDYTQAEEAMGKVDPRKGKLVAAGENDVTASLTDARAQRIDTNNPPAPRFTIPEREQQARASWESFVTTGKVDEYDTAVREGLRLTPRMKSAEFVGDMAAAEILPKSELPLRADMYRLQTTDPVTQQMKEAKGAIPLNIFTILDDSRFDVYPTNLGMQTLERHPRRTELAPTLFEVKDPVWQQMVDTQGWEVFITSLVKLSNKDMKTVFKEGKIKLRPSMSWNSQILNSGPDALGMPIEISTSLPEKEAKTALQAHRASIPKSALKGVEVEEQVPQISGIWKSKLSIESANPPPAGQVQVIFGLVIDPKYEQIINSWIGVAQKLMTTLGVKQRLIVVAVDKADIDNVRDQFTTNDWDSNKKHFTKKGFSAWMSPLTSGDVMLYLPPRDDLRLITNWAHEFGHALSYWALASFDPKHQAQIYAAYRRYILTYRHGDNQRHYKTRGKNFRTTGGGSFYFKKFEEWFAEQVSRWSTSSAKPLGHVAKFFRRLGRQIITALRAFRKEFGDDMRAEPVIQDWLDAVYSGNANWSVGVRETLVEVTRAANAQHGVNIPLQAESVKASQVLEGMFDGAAPPGAGTPGNHTKGAIRAQLDKFNWVMKWGFGYHQVAQENMHIPEVQRYTEGMRMSRLDVNNIMAEAETILKQFMRPLRGQTTAGKTQSVRLADFLFDMTEMNYRTSDEVTKGIRRNPTPEEFQALVRKHKLSSEAVTAYEQIREFFVKAVLRGEEVAILEARQVFAQDPAQQQIAVATAQMMTRKLLNAPYFPMTRFGEWAVTIRSATGGVERFETFESKKEQQEALQEAMRQYPEAQGWSVRASVLPDDVKGFAGMPPWFLDRLQTMPGMTPQQQEWIKLLRYQVAPARSFRKHLLPRKRTAGFSRDMERVFARYAFQHARNYGRIKYQRFLESQIKSLRGEVFQPGHGDVNKRSQMANFLQDHLTETMNPTSDWHMLRSATSVWYLGFVPSSAALNMTQSVLMTAPFLGSKFGDSRAMKAMMKAGGQISTFYKRGSYEGQTAAHMRMLDFLIKRGDVTESMAAELAGLAAGNALDSYFGFGEKGQRAWLAFADKAMLLFKMVEQWNRRVAARATFDLAMTEPNNDYVLGMKNKYFLQYQKMISEGFGTETEILATLAAGDAIVSTHYDYSKEARPRFMRGKAGLLFAFYMFTQNTIFQLTSRENKGLFIRYALIMTLIAGPMGLLPDEGEDVLEFIGKKYFGKDFHLKLAAREWLNNIMSPEWSDLVLHGTGRSSFGIPALLEALGGPSTPEIDFSRLVELRGLAPLPITPGLDVVGGRGADTEKMLSRWTQDIAGAAFGLPFAWAMALGDTELDWGDPKRWERAVPRAMGKVMGAWRRYNEGGHRVGRSNYVLEYDTSDPVDVAEIVAMGLGFTPTREALNWDVASAKMEVSMFWKSKRQALLARAYEAKFGKWKNPDLWKEARRAIQDFNKEALDPTLRITMDTMKRSFDARRKTARDFLQGEGPNIPPRLGKDIREQFPDTKRVGERKIELGGATGE